MNVRSWKFNLAAASMAQLLCIVGFTTSLSFVPFYVRELGVTEPHQIEWWAGILTSVGAISMALVSPIWGVLSDRHGRKLMVERAAFGGAIVAIAMSFVGNVHQLLVLRFVHGVLSGTIAAFITLAASLSPASEIGFSLGLMQMAVYTGYSVGPMIGGLVADQVGYRWTFRVTGALLILAGVLVALFVHERFEAERSGGLNRQMAASLSTIAHSVPVVGAIVAMGVIYAGNYASRPLLPLLVESLLPTPERVNTSTGLVYGAAAAASAASAVLLGRFTDRVGHRAILLACSVGVAISYVGQAASPTLGVLVLSSAITGLFAGGVLPAANAVLARLVPKEQQGAIYGMSNSVNAGGRAVGPLLGAAFSAAWGLRAAFLAAAAVYLLVTGLVAWTVPRRRPAAAESLSDQRL